MTKKISEQAAKAFYEQRNFKKSNTEVRNSDGVMGMFLFDNLIASWRVGSKDVFGRQFIHFNMCGWNSVTTRDRLKALGINIRSQQNQPYWIREGIASRIADDYTYYYEIPKEQLKIICWPNKDLRSI